MRSAIPVSPNGDGVPRPAIRWNSQATRSVAVRPKSIGVASSGKVGMMEATASKTARCTRSSSVTRRAASRAWRRKQGKQSRKTFKRPRSLPTRPRGYSRTILAPHAGQVIR